MEQTKKQTNITLVGLIFMIYITAWRCFTGENIQPLLYGGYAIVAVVTLVKMMMSDVRSISLTRYTSQLFAFSIFCVLSILWAAEPSLARSHGFFVFACVILVIIMSNYFVNIGNVNMLYITIVVMGIVMAATVIIEEGGLGAFYDSATESAKTELKYGVRVGGELFNANTIGMTCGYSSVVLFYYALFQKKRYCYAIMIFPVISLIASASRKALLLLVVGILLLLYFHQKEKNSMEKYLKILLGGIAIIVVFQIVMSLDIMYTVSNRMKDFFNFFEEDSGVKADNSTTLRMEMIRIGWKQFLFKPFLGIGIGNSNILNMVKLNVQTYSHNDYIEHLVNGGIVGFVLYYSMFYSMIKEYWRILKQESHSEYVVSFVIMILMLIMNFGCVTYYVELTTYVYFILWFSQLEIRKRQDNPPVKSLNNIF